MPRPTSTLRRPFCTKIRHGGRARVEWSWRHLLADCPLIPLIEQCSSWCCDDGFAMVPISNHLPQSWPSCRCKPPLEPPREYNIAPLNAGWSCCFVTALLPAPRTAMTRPLHNTAKGTDSDNIKKRKRNSIPRRSKLPFRFRPSSRSLNSEPLVMRIHRDSATSSLMQSLGFSFSSLHLSLPHTMMHEVTVSASTMSTPQAHFRTLTLT